MKQIIQSYKTGKMEVVDVPIPTCNDSGVLIKTESSLISAGTEKMLIDIAKKSMLGKAKARPDLVKQVLNKMKKEGIKNTLEKVQAKLEVPIPLGYSCAGEVKLASQNTTGLKAGDRVACGGVGFANHAEVNYVPQNLTVKIPDNVSYDEASFATVASIALQGVRQLDPTLGEKIAVYGVGLIGLITVQLLKANGCDVIAIDINDTKLEQAKKMGADVICKADTLQSVVEDFTQGHGTDGVIITASTKSNDVIVSAGEISRLKGRIIMVGLTPIDIPRDIYYKKELDFRLSMSYGPGRYDPTYELKGIDYPLSYVRWTEQRNMATILSLISQGRLDIKSLITHRYDFADVLDAYRLVSGEIEENYIGIVLQYKNKSLEQKTFKVNVTAKQKTDHLNWGIIGSGNFAQAVALPNLKKAGCNFHTLYEPNGVNATVVSRNYNFKQITTDEKELFENDEINSIMITTPHNTHAGLVKKGLENNRNVLVEKPIAITEEELKEIKAAYEKSNSVLMVGFNRRFSPHAEAMRNAAEKLQTPLVMNYIVNAGAIPVDHWTQDKEVGGGRIIGEVCHFVDFMQKISGELPVSVFANAINTDNKNFSNNDSVNISIEFSKGSIGNISYFAVGDKALEKEYFEFSGDGCTAKMVDFKKTIISKAGKKQKIKTGSQEKGFVEEYKAFTAATKNGQSPISFESLYLTTLTTIRAIESINTGLKLSLDLD